MRSLIEKLETLVEGKIPDKFLVALDKYDGDYSLNKDGGMWTLNMPDMYSWSKDDKSSFKEALAKEGFTASWVRIDEDLKMIRHKRFPAVFIISQKGRSPDVFGIGASGERDARAIAGRMKV